MFGSGFELRDPYSSSPIVDLENFTSGSIRVLRGG